MNKESSSDKAELLFFVLLFCDKHEMQRAYAAKNPISVDEEHFCKN